MMIVTKGSVNVSTYFHLRLAADGTDATGLTITNIDLQYTRSGAAPAAKVDATALAAAESAHSDNTAFEIDGTDQPGVYRVDWPDAAFASGVDEVILTVKVATAFTESLRVLLIDAVRGLAGTALPNAAADAAGGLPISDAGGLDLDARVGNLPTAAPGAAGGLFIAGTNAPVTIAGSGTALTLQSTGGNGHGLHAQADGVGTGIVAEGGAIGFSALGLEGFVAEGDSGAGFRATGTSGPGATFEASSGNHHGATFVKSGSGKDLDAEQTDNLDAAVSTRASQTSVDDLPTNAELTAALAAADDAVLAAIAALNNLSAAAVNAEVDQAISDAALATAAALSTAQAAITAIKTKTDSLTFGVAGKVDANVTHINETEVIGDGDATPWGPA